MNGIAYGYRNVVTNNEKKFVDGVFKKAQDTVKKQEVRDADWGLAAAQTCLARDLVTAGPEEAGLIMDKIEFVSKHLNENIQVDSDILSRQASDKREAIKAKADSKASQAEYVKALGDTTTQVIGGVTKAANDVSDLVNPLKGLDLIA